MTGIFCAIDKDNVPDATALVRQLSGLGLHIKLGLEFFVACGPSGVAAVRDVMDAHARLFLDLKLHDIPNTVAGAVRSAEKSGADFITLHASGGMAMMQAAHDAANTSKLLAVTVLTSIAADDAVSDVLRLGADAKQAGIHGIVSSAHETAQLRSALGRDIILVTPGIRPEGSTADDQARIMTPQQAVSAGADYLVIGRPITAAKDPVTAVRGILSSLGNAAAA